MSHLVKTMKAQTEEVSRAGVQPTYEQVRAFGEELGDNLTLSEVLNRFESVATVDSSSYFFCDIDEQKEVAELLQRSGLSLRELYTFTLAPIDTGNPQVLTSL